MDTEVTIDHSMKGSTNEEETLPNLLQSTSSSDDIQLEANKNEPINDKSTIIDVAEVVEENVETKSVTAEENISVSGVNLENVCEMEEGTTEKRVDLIQEESLANVVDLLHGENAIMSVKNITSTEKCDNSDQFPKTNDGNTLLISNDLHANSAAENIKKNVSSIVPIGEDDLPQQIPESEYAAKTDNILTFDEKDLSQTSRNADQVLETSNEEVVKINEDLSPANTIENETDSSATRPVDGDVNETDSSATRPVDGGVNETDSSATRPVDGGVNETDSSATRPVGGGVNETDSSATRPVDGGVNETDSSATRPVDGGVNETDSSATRPVDGGVNETDSEYNETPLNIENDSIKSVLNNADELAQENSKVVDTSNVTNEEPEKSADSEKLESSSKVLPEEIESNENKSTSESKANEPIKEDIPKVSDTNNAVEKQDDSSKENGKISTNEEHDQEDISMEQIDCDKSITNNDGDGDQEADEDLSVLNDVDPIGISQDADIVEKDFENKEQDEKEIEDLDSGKGADEELCIIPDTDRVISQAEKDAATAKRSAEKELLKMKEVDAVGDQTEVDPITNDKEPETTSAVDGESTSQKEKAPDEHYEITNCSEGVRTCGQCYLVRTANFKTAIHNKTVYICDKNCMKAFAKEHPNHTLNINKEPRIKLLTPGQLSDSMVSKISFLRKCQDCCTEVSPEDNSLSWETMDFCNEDCLSKYQMSIGSKCSTCQAEVRVNCLGKYCVRFGYDIRQFCSSTCLEDFKKGLKVCVYCQKDISGCSDGFLAPVGDKGQFKDFCSHLCMEKYDVMSNPKPSKSKVDTCSVCATQKTIAIEFELNGKLNKFCNEPCFVAFKFVNNITPGQCDMCRKYYDSKILEMYTMFYDGMQLSFCGKSCQNIYITAHRTIVSCSWCKVKKYNFDMIKKTCSNGQVLMMCSINCLSLFQVSINAVSSKKVNCDNCRKNVQAMYHLTMSDATIRNFCCYNCVMSFQNQFSKLPIRLDEDPNKPVPTGVPKRNSIFKQAATQNNLNPTTTTSSSGSNLVITNVQSLATSNGPVTRTTRSYSKNISGTATPVSAQPSKPNVITHVIVKNRPVPKMANKWTMVKPIQHTKGVNCKVHMVDKEVETEEIKEKTVLIPIPVPIYVPTPVTMWAAPFPMPVPFPIPIPVPIFIPTTRNSANGIMKEIKKIQVKIPTDPFEAELLMMAEMVAGEKKTENTDSESEEDDAGGADGGADGSFSPEAVDTSNAFGEDMLQMALKMATELDEPAVDLEGALAASTITASQGQETNTNEETVDDPQPMHAHHMMERQSARGRKRSVRQTRQTPNKRSRRMSQQEMPIMQPQAPPPPPEPIEKPDANMCLKWTFGVNAWKQWVTIKNAELEKSSRRVKLFKNEILQLNSDELNYSLCLFVKEVRKPNGQEYAPDTIYYLCLGIQQYLFENGRIDNIFTDPYYEKFTECLDEIARKFSVLYNDSHYIVTRVEEEHLWESKQLGAHSPHVLLSTLMFFNTKHFNLTTVEEHMQLSFSHIMKHWKRNPNAPGTAKAPGSRNVLLRFYPPQTTLEANNRKKKVYEQQENEENPLRCPVKLYEFYLSKCPESVKTRNDVFYLRPERSCVPDSPVWYSTMPLEKEDINKMLHRVKMVKEINVSLLTS